MTLDQTGLQLGNFMSYLSQRQEVIASNIANADTPGYQTRDVEMPADFSSALFDARKRRRRSTRSAQPQRRQQRLDRSRGPTSFGNTMKFNVATQMIRAELKNIRSAIDEGRSS